MHYHSAVPSAPLRFLVKQYWGMENCFSHGSEHTERIIPTGLPVLYCYLADQPTIVNENRQLKAHSYLCGQYNQFYDLRVRGNIQLFATVLQPYAIPILLGLPSSELFNDHVPLQDILMPTEKAIICQIAEAENFEQRVNIMENFMLGRLYKKTLHDHLSRMMKSISVMAQENLITTIQLADHACLSRKQYERVFQQFIGLPPRQFIKILRLQKSIFRQQTAPFKNMSQLALSCGYFDQAHMNHEFKILTGMSPKKYFSICPPQADFFMS